MIKFLLLGRRLTPFSLLLYLTLELKSEIFKYMSGQGVNYSLRL